MLLLLLLLPPLSPSTFSQVVVVASRSLSSSSQTSSPQTRSLPYQQPLSPLQPYWSPSPAPLCPHHRTFSSSLTNSHTSLRCTRCRRLRKGTEILHTIISLVTNIFLKSLRLVT